MHSFLTAFWKPDDRFWDGLENEIKNCMLDCPKPSYQDGLAILVIEELTSTNSSQHVVYAANFVLEIENSYFCRG
ncbi:hypothetical protein MFRU_005g03010 [Monilinia fructicola]|nr:hypothetical protein MFRU_005g03010 [Monilinia fructicola]